MCRNAKFQKIFAAKVNMNCSESHVERFMQQFQDLQEAMNNICRIPKIARIVNLPVMMFLQCRHPASVSLAAQF